MQKELISVICTVKDAESTISTTIESVLEQTYENWEMVIVDDGSSDKTPELLRRYSELDKRIKPHYTNGIGRGNALNKAIELSASNFIANIDADDLMHPQRLEIQSDVFNKNNSVFLIATASKIIYEQDICTWDNTLKAQPTIKNIGSILLKKNVINHSSVFMDKRKLVKVGCYDGDRKTQLDAELWLRAYTKKEKMILIDEELTAKRIHINQSFENKKRLKYLVNAVLLKTKYNLKNRKNYHLILFVFPMQILFGLLPFKVRHKINEFLVST